MSNNKFCTECGSGIEDTSKFCTKCGSQQSKETNQPSTREIADEMIKAQKKEEQKKQNIKYNQRQRRYAQQYGLKSILHCAVPVSSNCLSAAPPRGPVSFPRSCGIYATLYGR